MLKFFVADQCTKKQNKHSQPTCLDVFDKNLHALMSHVTCYASSDTIIFIIIFFVGQSDGARWLRVCYQRGLPHLVLFVITIFSHLQP